jgi:hypothetical protein
VPDSATISGDTHRTSVDVPDQELLTPISEEKPKQQQKIGRSSTRSSEDDSIEARRTANPNILTRSGNIQQPPVKESMQEAQVSRNQQHADQAVSQSTQEMKCKLKKQRHKTMDLMSLKIQHQSVVQVVMVQPQVLYLIHSHNLQQEL